MPLRIDVVLSRIRLEIEGFSRDITSCQKAVKL